MDSGAFNPELNAQVNGPEATKLWAKSRLRDRIDSVIAHEHLEALAGLYKLFRHLITQPVVSIQVVSNDIYLRTPDLGHTFVVHKSLLANDF